MPRLQNPETGQVRNCVSAWLARTLLKEFTTYDVLRDIVPQLEHLRGANLNRAVSNDLIRRAEMGLLRWRKGTKADGLTVGRPPRYYHQPFKMFDKVVDTAPG